MAADRPDPDPAAELRRRRREWILAHHPDRGGDPAEFAAGLARLGSGPSPDGTDNGRPAGTRPTVHRSRNPVRRVRRLITAIVRARQGRSRRLL